MTDDSSQSPLLAPRSALVVMAVVMLIGLVGARQIPFGRRGADRSPWLKPSIRRLSDEKALADETLGIRVVPAPGFSFFEYRPEDVPGLSALNRSAAVVARITPFDSQAPWPPPSTEFGDAASIVDNGEDAPFLRIGPMDREDVLIRETEYEQANVSWASPRHHAAWPVRMHIGRAVIGDRTFRLVVFEMQAETAEPSYERGPLADLVNSLSPL